MITYLPIPKIENTTAQMLLGASIYISRHPGYVSNLVMSRSVIASVRNAFKEVTPSRLVVWLQQIDKRFNEYVHVDPRTYTLSYLLQTGGPKVVTCLHNEDHSVKQAIELEAEQWHIIKTDELHSVNGIEGARVSLSISVGEQINADLLPWCNSVWTKNNANPTS